MQYANNLVLAPIVPPRATRRVPFPLEERRLRMLETHRGGNSHSPAGYVNAPRPARLFFRRDITFPRRWMTLLRLRPLMATINYQDIDKFRGIVEEVPGGPPLSSSFVRRSSLQLLYLHTYIHTYIRMHECAYVHTNRAERVERNR